MAVGDIVTLRAVGRYQDQNIVNTMHYQIVDQAISEQQILDALCADWDTNMSSLWCGRHQLTYELIGVKAFNHTGDAKRPGFKAIGTPGLVVGDALLAHTCRTITLYTDSDKHRRRGRIMLSGSEKSMFDASDGSVDSVEVTALEVLGTALMQTLAVNGDSFQLCIPPTLVDPVEIISSVRGRVTPSVVTSRRIRQFLIG